MSNQIPKWLIEMMPPNTQCKVKFENGEWYLNGRHVTKSEKVVRLVNGNWQAALRQEGE